MKLPGGRRSVLIRSARALWLETRPLPTISDRSRIEGATTVVNNIDLRNADRRSRRRILMEQTQLGNGLTSSRQIDAGAADDR